MEKNHAVKLEFYSDTHGFDALRPEWEPLLARSAVNEIFLTWDWQTTWWDAYHPGDLWLLAGRDETGQLVGIASWFLEQRCWP